MLPQCYHSAAAVAPDLYSCSQFPPVSPKRAATNSPGHPQTCRSRLQSTCHHVSAVTRSVFSGHPHAVLLRSRQFCPLAVSSLQSLLSEPLLIANMSEERAIAGSKHAGSPQTCQAASKLRPPPALSAALRSKDYATEGSELA